jgi:hypothetical protein
MHGRTKASGISSRSVLIGKGLEHDDYAWIFEFTLTVSPLTRGKGSDLISYNFVLFMHSHFCHNRRLSISESKAKLDAR